MAKNTQITFDNFEPVTDFQTLQDINDFNGLVKAAVDTNEREITNITQQVLSGKVSPKELSDKQKYDVAVCLLMGGFTWMSVQDLLS